MTSYASCRPCTQCGAHGEQVWIDTWAHSSTYGLCQQCRGIPIGDNMTMILRAQPDALALRPDLQALDGWLSEVLALASMHTIDVQEDLELAGQVLAEVTAAAKKIAAAKLESTAPHTKALADARGAFVSIEGRISQATALWKQKIIAGSDAMRARTQAAVAAMAAAPPEDRTTLLAVIRLPQKEASFQTREVWDYEVVAPAELPREFLKPDEAAIRKAMGHRLDGVPVPIPGVRWFQKAVIASTG